MSIIVVRHGLSEANNHENIGTLAFGAADAPLMEKGREQARAVGTVLLDDYAIRPDEPVAVSTYLRTQQTATEAGFTRQTQYEQLREVDHGMDLADLRAMLDANRIPDTAVAHAESLLGAMPPERVWFTHGLVIAGLCKVLDVYTDRLKPRFGEVRELPL